MGYIQSKTTEYDTELKAMFFFKKKDIDYRDNLFIFCKAGVIQVARPLFGLIYGTWETTYKCQAILRLPI